VSTTDPGIETIGLTVDGRELQVPKGTPLVLAAARAGVEVPVFCYEPRLGPAVGACRMCLVEVEGMPKLQAACTMTATDGMIVRTRSERAAGGQAATLEFLLINHPLDCPICDKGGECPLQDLTFRYGPGNTRFRLPKRTYEKPVAVSPLIALDRERCILCYRCTRFSSDVAEDEQLIALDRGSRSVIATFQEGPYVGAFSGNVIELCPVGALTSTDYRFRARPWEITNVPTTCGLCPTGCQTSVTVREEAVSRVLSRNHPEVDEGWLCDKGRFGHGHLAAPDRYRGPLVRGRRGLEEATWEEAADTVARRLRHYVNLHGPESVAVVASGEQSNEEAYAWAAVVEAGGGGSLVGCPDAAAGAWEILDPYRAAIDDLDHADVVAVAGDHELVDVGGVVELRLRKAVRGGATLILAGAGGTPLDRNANERLPSAPGRVTDTFDALAERLAAAERPVLLVTDPVDLTLVARLAHTAGLHARPGGVLPLPHAPNARGIRFAGFGDDPEAVLERAERGEVRMLVLLGDADPVSHWPGGERWRAAVERADSVVASAMFPNAVTGWAHVILPATAAFEKEGTFSNAEGRTQRLRPTVAPPHGIVPEVAFLAAVAGRLERQLRGDAPGVHREMVAARPAFTADTWAETMGRAGLERRVPDRSVPAPATATPPPPPAAAAGSGLQVVATRPLFSGPAVWHTPRLHFQRPDHIVLNLSDARRLGIGPGETVTVRHAGGQSTGPARLSRTLVEGAVRLAWTGPPLSGPCTVEAGGA
jgi:NADH-quinone oxidoreductase subunit G